VLKAWLAHPLTRGVDLDDPQTTWRRREIVQQKRFLRRIYDEWYRMLAAAVPDGAAPVLELGSGAGFMQEYVRGLITTEIFRCPSISAVLDAQRLPFPDASLRAIVMTDVLHHLPQARRFFAEAGRCVQPGGVIAVVEPWVTSWSTLIYTRLHHEPFRPDAGAWEFPASGPLSGANGALPWMLFQRDRAAFEREFPQWRIETIRPFMPFRYLVSGGVSLRGLTPAWSFGGWRLLERALSPWMDRWAMFAFVVLRRQRLPADETTGSAGAGVDVSRASA
jgi:SAM-dependent methyltransferase